MTLSKRATMASKSVCRAVILSVWRPSATCQSAAFCRARRARLHSIAISVSLAAATARTRASAVSRAAIHALIRRGWLIRNGAMPRPVELPTPRQRRNAGSIRTAVCGARLLAICSARSIEKVRINQTARSSGWNDPVNSGLLPQQLRSAAPNLPDP